MYNNDVGKGVVYAYEAYEANKVWWPFGAFLLHKSLTDVVIVHIYTTKICVKRFFFWVPPAHLSKVSKETNKVRMSKET